MSHDPLQCGDYLQLCIKTRLDRRPRVIAAPPHHPPTPPSPASRSLSRSLALPSVKNYLQIGSPTPGNSRPLAFLDVHEAVARSSPSSPRPLASRPACTVVHVGPPLPWLLFFFFTAAHQQEATDISEKQTGSRCHVSDIQYFHTHTKHPSRKLGSVSQI